MPDYPTDPVIRPYRLEDAEAVAAVFRDAVLVTGRARYSYEQTVAWAAPADDPIAFGARRMTGLTFVAEVDRHVVAFAQLRPEDHVDMLFCAPSYARRGIASRLLADILAEAHGAGTHRVTADVSLVARTVFERAGFRVEAEETVERNGARFNRYRMAISWTP